MKADAAKSASDIVINGAPPHCLLPILLTTNEKQVGTEMFALVKWEPAMAAAVR